MAVVDATQDALVIRILYDGPPLAGKTTSLRTLAAKLGGVVHSPQEVSGRTLYFDWLTYTGGLFEGRRICCQIVSVPGQATLASRRRHLLASADAVVFVCDTTRAGLASTVSYLRGTQAVIGGVAGPVIGIVVQANKRDHPDAAPLEQVRAELRREPGALALVEAVATEGAGIRETFVLAVRLALDRVREMIRRNALPVGQPLIASSDELLADLQSTEGDALQDVADAGLSHIRLSEVTDGSVGRDAFLDVLASNAVQSLPTPVTQVGQQWGTPRLPSSDLPSGMIWPPVGGRLILNEMADRPPAIRLMSDGAWRGQLGEWSVESPAGALYADAEAGRHALVEWAQAHAACGALLSNRRAIALTVDAMGQYRLWQIVATAVTLRTQLAASISSDPAMLAARLLEATRALAHLAQASVSVGCKLPLDLEELSVEAELPCYCGFMPHPAQRTLPRLAPDLAKILTGELKACDVDVSRLGEALQIALGNLESEKDHECESILLQVVMHAG
jgi:signal recognition particle receptor subunit beta